MIMNYGFEVSVKFYVVSELQNSKFKLVTFIFLYIIGILFSFFASSNLLI